MNPEQQRASNKLRASLDDVLDLIAEYPRLALPVGVLVALFGLATVFKTLIDGFAWAYGIHGILGVLTVVGVGAVTSSIAIWLVREALAPRPVIQPFPAHHLSRSPIIKWEYRDGKYRDTSYELRVKLVETGKIVSIAVPERMHQIAVPDIIGPMEVTVYANDAGRSRFLKGRFTWRGRSSSIVTEIYRDSVQRIQKTGKLRIAVHTDPAEEIFCYYRNGRWQGLDTDFATLIASELERDRDIARPIDIAYSFFEWPAIIGAPSEHEVDMAIASITISAERSKKYGIYFSRPYAESALGVVAYSRALAGGIPGGSIQLQALKGKKVAIHKDTMALAFVESAVENGGYDDIGIQKAENNDELRELLRNNSVDAVVHDYYRAFTLIEADITVYRLQDKTAPPTGEYGIAFSRVNMRLLEKVDAILDRHKMRIRTALARCIDERRRAILPQSQTTAPANPDRPPVSGEVNLFVYGSLMFDEVWQRVAAVELESRPVSLSGYRRLKIKNEDYPGLVRGIGIVSGILRLGVDEKALHAIDTFEAACYRRVSGMVIDEAGTEIPAEFYLVKESDQFRLEKTEWDKQEFERYGLSRFIREYHGFKS